MKQRNNPFAALVVFALLLTSCLGDGGSDNATSITSTSAPTSETRKTSVPTSQSTSETPTSEVPSTSQSSNPTSTSIPTPTTSSSSSSQTTVPTSSSTSQQIIAHYTVTWDVNGSITTEDYIQGEIPLFKGNTSKACDAQYTYTFTGWSPAISAVTQDVTYVAQYSTSTNKYIVTWNVAGNVTTEEYNYGATPSFKGDTSKASDAQYTYEFNGWYPSIDVVTQNITYVAQYSNTVNHYTITWDVDGVTTTEDYAYGDTPTFKGSKDKAGDAQYAHNFTGWSPEILPVTQDATYVAQYSSTVNHYTVTWNIDGNTKTEDYAYGDIPVYKDGTPTKQDDAQYSYSFEGWNPSISQVTGNATYEAVFSSSLEKAKIIFDLNGGTSFSSTSPIYKSSINSTGFFFDCVKEGWNFRGWSYNGVKVFDEKGIQLSNPPITDTMTFVAMYSQTVKVAITTNINDAGVISGQGEYVFNSNITVSAHPKQGYVFVGWYYQNMLISTMDEYNHAVWDEDVTYEARFKLDTFTMNIYSNDENYGSVKFSQNENYSSNQQEDYDYTSQVTIAALTKTSVRFLGWYNSNNELVSTKAIYSFTMPNYNYTLEAKWNHFTVSYNLGGGVNNIDNPTSYNVDCDPIPLLAATRTHYDFVRWEYNGETVEEINPNWKKDITAEAVWALHEYSISYELDGGDNNPNNVSYYNIESGTIALNDPTKEEYKFYGWYLEPEFTNEVTEITASNGGDITLYAKFVKIINIVLNVGEGSINNNIFGVCYGEEYTLPVPTGPTGYDFDHWLFNDQIIDQSGVWTLSTQTITLTAVYKISGLNFTLSENGQYYIASSYEGTATGVTIPDEYRFKPVCGIGMCAFQDSSLASVTIPNSIVYISDAAFAGCSSLTSVNIGNSVASIGSNAFAGCSSLTSIVIPNSVTSIGANAFEYCSKLTSVNIPNSVTSIVGGTFCGCSNLESITLPFVGGSASATKASSSTLFGYIFGTRSYEGGVSTKQYYSSNSTSYSATYYIPLSLKNVIVTGGQLFYGAFYSCSNLTSITIGNDVTSIGAYAFSGCSSLESITLPFVGREASADSPSSSTLFGYIFGTSSYEGGVATKQYYSSNSTSYSATYYIPSSLKNVTVTGGQLFYGAFYDCSSLTSIVIPDDVTSIGHSAFSGCSSLTSIVIPDSVTSIGGCAFAGCSSLTSIVIPDGVTLIGETTFSGCSSLTSIVIPDGVVSIGSDAFSGCSSLTSIVIPDGVTSIGYYAFSGCSSLTSIVIPDGVTSIGGRAFAGCSSLTSIVIPDGVTSIDNFAFAGCSSLTSIIIPDSVTSIGERAFSGCSSLTSIVIPDGVTFIREGTFSGCSSLTSIVIPDNVNTIGEGAFAGCSSLTSIVIPNRVTTIVKSAFSGCSSLTSIVIPDRVTSIGEGAFSGCSSLQSITLPFVGGSASADSASSSSLFGYIFGTSSYEGGVATQQYYSSSNSATYYIPSSLKHVTITGVANAAYSDGIRVYYGAFYNCSSLTSVVISKKVTYIANYAFSYCSSLTIYCEAASKPSKWAVYWNSTCPVVWGYTGE